jgi:ERCC4-type nuclease
MPKIIDQLKIIKGIGTTLAERLVDAGLTTFEDVATAEKKTLKDIKGIKEADIEEIQADAKKLAKAERERQERLLESLLEDTEKLKEDMRTLVEHIRNEAKGDANSKTARAMRKEISRIMASLEKVEDTLFGQMKRIGKGLAKAEAKISRLVDGDMDEITEGLAKARKKIDKALE